MSDPQSSHLLSWKKQPEMPLAENRNINETEMTGWTGTCAIYFYRMPMEEFCNAFCFKGWNLRKAWKETPTLPIEKLIFPLIFQRHQNTFQILLQIPPTNLYMFPLSAFSSEAHLRRLKLQIQRHWSFWRRASHFEVCSAVFGSMNLSNQKQQGKICPSKYPEQDANSMWIHRNFLRKKVNASSNHD